MVTMQYAVESWMGSQDRWSIHATWTEAKGAALRPSDWGRVWFAEEGFEIDPSTGSVSVQRTDPIQLVETWSGDVPLLEEEEEDGLDFEPYEDLDEFSAWLQEQPVPPYRDDGFFPPTLA